MSPASRKVNQLITAQTMQKETIIHIVSILNVTRHIAQVKRQHTNIVMDAVDKMVHDVNNLYNITTSLYTSLNYHQLILHIRSVLANLWDSLSYIKTFSMHTMDYIDAATNGTLSPHILPIADLKQMLSNIEETLPPTLHLPVSSEDTLHFYRYLCTHVLIANKQFLLLIDIPIQDHMQQLSVYKIFTLDIPHGNFTAQYDVNSNYLGVTQDKTMAVEVSQHHFSIPSSIAPNVWILTSAPSTVTTGITLICPGETTKFIHVLQLPPACRATYPCFHLPP